jgi:hypothetical protein
MFRARPAGPASAIDRPVRPSRRRRDTAGRWLASVRHLLARVVHLVVGVVVLIIVAGILLVVLKANPTNGIVSDVHGWARSLVGPFAGIFSLRNPRAAIGVNWGVAAVVYSLAGGLIVRLIGDTRR